MSLQPQIQKKISDFRKEYGNNNFSAEKCFSYVTAQPKLMPVRGVLRNLIFVTKRGKIIYIIIAEVNL